MRKKKVEKVLSELFKREDEKIFMAIGSDAFGVIAEKQCLINEIAERLKIKISWV